jgi:hypothetical protein
MRIIKQSTEDERFAPKKILNSWRHDIHIVQGISFLSTIWMNRFNLLDNQFSPARFFYRGYAENRVNNWVLVYI